MEHANKYNNKKNIHTHTYINTYMHTHTHIYIYIYIHVYIYLPINKDMLIKKHYKAFAKFTKKLHKIKEMNI
jgi:hypothetical protein